MMKRVLTLFVVTLLFSLSVTAAPAQIAPLAPQPAQSQDQTYQGQLSKVDIASKTITVKGADNKEMAFTFNEKTQMIGIENSPQGLSGKTGSNLKVTHARGSNLATRIEVASAPAKDDQRPQR